MRAFLGIVLLTLFAAPAAAQATLGLPTGDPRYDAAQGMAAARDRAAMADSFSRQAQSASANIALDRTADAQAGQRAAARADLARQRAEAEQAEAAEAQRREAEERLRLQLIDPAAAPK